MKKIAIITYPKIPNLSEADQALIPLFLEKGFLTEPKCWGDLTTDWQQYEFLLFRSTWDYHLRETEFKAWLDFLDNQGVRIVNSSTVIKRNRHKFYLQELENKGIQIIPTLFSSSLSPISLDAIKDKNWTRIVIKPAISAGAYLTEVIDVEPLTDRVLHAILKDSDWLIQPFLPEIEVNGEISMIFFKNEFSHSIIKMPKDGDFRVQKQFGGKYTLFQPSSALLAVGKNIVEQFDANLTYARVDGVVINGNFHLMELELIEPDLYFEFDKSFAQRLVDAI